MVDVPSCRSAPVVVYDPDVDREVTESVISVCCPLPVCPHCQCPLPSPLATIMLINNSVCFLGFVTQMCFVIYNLLHPLPVTTVKEVRLSDLEFPIVLKLCAHLMWDDNVRYREVGYTDEQAMYLGQSRYDPSKFGWSGHSENGSHLDISGIL